MTVFEPITGSLGPLVAQRETALKALEAEERNRVESGLRTHHGRFGGYNNRIEKIKFVIRHGRRATGMELYSRGER